MEDMISESVSGTFEIVGGILNGPILLPMSIIGWNHYFDDWNNVVKITDNNAKENKVMSALNKGNITSILLVGISSYFLTIYMLLSEIMIMDFFGEGMQKFSSLEVFYASLVGLLVGGLISSVTEYYTGLGKKPILKIVQQSSTGATTNIISGLATGMISTFPSILLFLEAI